MDRETETLLDGERTMARGARGCFEDITKLKGTRLLYGIFILDS